MSTCETFNHTLRNFKGLGLPDPRDRTPPSVRVSFLALYLARPQVNHGKQGGGRYQRRLTRS
ncbi:hypothetical protein E2C01_045564 [Portunus trituberculatus]|uniref:Transposase n=1 Tax=Portunus trituberculatus TaxID=210409 RepID=A0A5B7FYN5_PORTR|nr:hypothetical protein [Portunus trituberculatus]